MALRYFRFSLALFFLLLAVPAAHAEKVLFFSPTRLHLSDRDKVATVDITNLSGIARSYTVSIEDLVMNSEGVTQPVETFDYSARRMLRFVPRSFVLQPDQRQTVRVMVRFPPEAADGQYHSHLRFLENVSERAEINKDRENMTGAAIHAPLSYAAAIPVIVSKGAIDVKIGMKDLRVLRDPKTGLYNVSLKITREGNGQGTAYLDTEYISPSGQPVTASVRRTVYIYREISERGKMYEITLPEGSKFEKGGKIKVSLYDKPDSGSPVAEQIVGMD